MDENLEDLPPKERCIRRFRIWTVKTDDEFRQYVHRGQLNRREIAKECECSTSVLTQNTVIRGELEELEKNLRARGVLPILVDGKKQDAAQANNSDESRMRRLEVENATLKAEVKKFRLLVKLMTETGRLPR
jgi:hypothetical protein